MNKSRTSLVGTHYFRSVSYAEKYYAHYGYENVRKAVQEKIERAEVSIGSPDLKKYPNAIRSYADNEGRFHVVCEEKDNG